jgi:Uri superfamily endonuclease
MKGVYALILELSSDERIHVGKLGEISFRKGYYAYIGSAQRNIEPRIERHLRLKKKLHWHIDHLTSHAKVLEVYGIEGDKRMECNIAHRLKKHLESVEGFGCSDCRCSSHLFYADGLQDLKRSILESIEGVYYTLTSNPIS